MLGRAGAGRGAGRAARGPPSGSGPQALTGAPGALTRTDAPAPAIFWPAGLGTPMIRAAWHRRIAGRARARCRPPRYGRALMVFQSFRARRGTLPLASRTALARPRQTSPTAGRRSSSPRAPVGGMPGEAGPGDVRATSLARCGAFSARDRRKPRQIRRLLLEV